ncbi:FecCD family ABC transporter permease [Actinosynnema mirum]|uniref:Transport system permease protein n=1 Tax=Actinosynnema mirum (strain ATCC 29888 / DSM 43827 / JCM 3225 / NBRC 14064 / NCIMB 13271 / NRRL B-12336 / IMRU 3971 / 101) TaxID=446462 RepID=C6WNZ5_ACTMD|nr:iron ABC transporter permease [Actinosynnema mirum]ACU36664.1 transport system permease protein [Actinosynnema mirum DSM 43827]
MAAAAPRGLPVPTVVLALVVALLGSVVCGLALGAARLPFDQVLHLVRAGALGGWIDPDEVSAYQIVWEVRLPRVLLAVVVGAGLASVGAASQALVRNALADPFVLGVSSGASVGATAVIVLGVFGALGVHALSVAAFLGALGATALVHLAARSRGSVTPLRLVLTGTAMAYGFSAITTVLVFLAPHGDAARSALFWLLGGLGGVTWASLPVAAAVTAAGVLFLLLNARALDALAMGDETASALGVDPSSLRRKLFLVCALVTGCLVAVSGAVGFVGLMVPHVTRMVVGAGHRALLAVAPLVGAVLLVWVDLLARTAVAPQELPLGVLTSAIGVPVFVWLMRRRAYVFGGR